jgi:hypothetical protein
MFYLRRPTNIQQADINAIEATLTERLSMLLGLDFRRVLVIEELHSRTSLYIHCETSIEQYTANEKRIIRAILPVVLPYYYQCPRLECLVTRVDVWDDKVGLSDKWLHRDDLLAWHQQKIDDAALFARSTPYY